MDIQRKYKSPFLNIPQRKVEETIEDIRSKYINTQTNQLTCEGASLLDIINGYVASNIPVDYWFRSMGSFTGDVSLKQAYESISQNIKASYKEGASYCFAGSHGRGKSMTAASVLKKVVESRVIQQSRYTSLYVNLTDIINAMTSDGKHVAREELLSVDFLVIDEFDARFMGTENAADLFGRILEPTIRSRIQNRVPTIMCTNHPDPSSAFQGQLKLSFSSLLKLFKTVTALGKDHRAI